ncbi:MAG: ATPase domain-containing protein [Candidatus Bathyarchaeia archaeon]
MYDKVPTGCGILDKILEGGIPSESVSLIYGEAETGKTTLSMQCAANCALQGYKTLFIDCDGTFTSRRLSQIASGRVKEAAELIILMKPSNFREQTIVMERLADYVTKNFRLIVIDTITSLYSAEVAELPNKTFGLNRELNRQMALLAQMAKMRKLAIIVTSQVRSAFNEAYVSIEPVATRILKFWSDIIIAMRPTEHSGVIKAVLEKNPKRSPPVTCYLRIEEKGISEHLIRR